MCDKIPWKKKHVQAITQNSSEYIPFKPRKCPPPVDVLGQGLIPIYCRSSPSRQVANAEVMCVGNNYVCANISETMHNHIHGDKPPAPFRVHDLTSDNNTGFGNRMKNGVQVPNLGKRLEQREPWEEPLALTDPLMRDEVPFTRRGHVDSPTESPKRDQHERIFRRDDEFTHVEVDNHPVQRNLREHPNYFPAEEVSPRGRRHNIYPHSKSPTAESIRVLREHPNYFPADEPTPRGISCAPVCYSRDIYNDAGPCSWQPARGTTPRQWNIDEVGKLLKEQWGT